MFTPTVFKTRIRRRWSRVALLYVVLFVVILGIEQFRVSDLHQHRWGLRFMNYDGYWNAIELGLVSCALCVLIYGLVKTVLDLKSKKQAKIELDNLSQSKLEELIAEHQRHKPNEINFGTLIKHRKFELRIVALFIGSLIVFGIGTKFTHYIHDILFLVLLVVVGISGFMSVHIFLWIWPSAWFELRSKQIEKDEFVLTRKDMLHDFTGALSISQTMDTKGGMDLHESRSESGSLELND